MIRDGMALPGAGTYSTATLGYVLAQVGQRAQAEALLGELVGQSRRDYVSPVALATLYLGLGAHGQALDWTERAYEERRGWLAYLKVNPLVDPLRGHSRFDALLKKMRL